MDADYWNPPKPRSSETILVSGAEGPGHCVFENTFPSHPLHQQTGPDFESGFLHGRRKEVSLHFSSPVCVVHALSIVLSLAGCHTCLKLKLHRACAIEFLSPAKVNCSDFSLSVTKTSWRKREVVCQILLKAKRAFQLIVILFYRSFMGFKCAPLYIYKSKYSLRKKWKDSDIWDYEATFLLLNGRIAKTQKCCDSLWKVLNIYIS